MVAMKATRTEQEIFDDLAVLAASPGFAHVIAAFCMRDNFTWYRDEIRAEDMEHLYSRSRLIRTEMFTLVGLMARADLDYDAAPPENAVELGEAAEALLLELHDSMNRPWFEAIQATTAAGEILDRRRPDGAIREPIFYGGEGAFSFQNCDFAAEKYAKDDDWLLANRGASIRDMIAVANAIGELQAEKLGAALHTGARPLADSAILAAFTFTIEDLATTTSLPPETIAACVRSFTLPKGHGNPSFEALHNFNAANALPILAVDDERHLLFHFNALAEALYESPFYWFGADKRYEATALMHRGQYTEAFAVRRLEAVFGEGRVYHGVNIERGKGRRVSEIDVLVLFGDRAIVLQAKSKRLTLEARRGNDRQIQNDFKGAVQDSYNQAMDCAAALRDPTLSFVTSCGDELKIPADLSQIFPICLVADHYPALAFQAEQFLIRRDVDAVSAPLIIDVFTLDVMAEMLNRPLRFFSYLEQRAVYGDKVHIHHEITLLAYHLKYNLWLDDEFDFVMLEDDFAADIEIAMGSRRLGLPGKQTPDGILTITDGRTLDGIIRTIEAEPMGAMIDLVLLVYQLSGNAMKELLDGVDRAISYARAKGSSDFSMGFAGTGVTIHSNFAPRAEAEPRLTAHMSLCKYRQRTGSWFGLSISPTDCSLRFGKKAIFPWVFDSELDRVAKQFGKPNVPGPVPQRGPKLGRNEPCHCGSGKKYKKCHLSTDQGG